jgi:hypothetical protein
MNDDAMPRRAAMPPTLPDGDHLSASYVKALGFRMGEKRMQAGCGGRDAGVSKI